MKKTMLIFSLILCLLLTGCDYEAIIDEVVHEVANQLTEPEDVVEPFIGFSETEAEKTEQLLQLEPEEVRNYESRYSMYNSYTYFTHLNDSEKLLYRAYEYALDEALPYFWVDDRLLQDMERTEFEVLEMLALDSAVVEQNVSIANRGYTVTHTVLNVETASEAYTAIYVENFSREKLQRKEEAILQAKDDLSKLQNRETLSHREVAEYIYDLLGTNVTYETDIEGEEYLYTALCEGRTNCDGYTNAFALMCALCDIPCIEINSDIPDGEEGHTWNAVYLEDQWVHVDATGAEQDVNAECESRKEERIYFGFPDALLEDRVQYADLIPACPEGLTPVVHIPSGDVENFQEKVEAAFEENDNKVAVFLVDEGDLEKQITQELVNELGFAVYYLHYQTADGKTVYYLFNNE
jgi:hypothetical protein